ncbi:16S rRNA (uracil(1498)-N(3))-methyltransferase [Ramlibacter sp. AN1015]|uniref:16S rRNA (uracil(1498)-N(3))-methyltransferase n=1 Tax=Ramlibacter sp. AN1015 TaxID=3133428 RepID=UPI0030BFCC06
MAASSPRFFCPTPLVAGQSLELPPGAARHAQVLRLQPGAPLTLFDGHGGEWSAAVERMGRSAVAVRVVAHSPIERESARSVHLALGMPANERMDWLVEKATELGATGFQPLLTERSVLRLSGERADRKRAHWQGIAAAAAEQCGRNRVPTVAPVQELQAWCATLAHSPARRLVLSLEPDATALASRLGEGAPVLLLSGPEGGLAPAELRRAREHGFEPVSLGPRVLRADTAPLAALALLTLTA